MEGSGGVRGAGVTPGSWAPQKTGMAPTVSSECQPEPESEVLSWQDPCCPRLTPPGWDSSRQAALAVQGLPMGTQPSPPGWLLPTEANRSHG